jgi:type I site-specific restriction endonuclease
MSNASFLFPDYGCRLRAGSKGKEIWDDFRKKWVVCTPEEWVRQHFLHYLVQSAGYPASRIAVERKLQTGAWTGRFDAVIFDPNGHPFMLIECKAPEVAIDPTTFFQSTRYSQTLQVPYVALTNGRGLWVLELKSGTFLQNWPSWA